MLFVSTALALTPLPDTDDGAARIRGVEVVWNTRVDGRAAEHVAIGEHRDQLAFVSRTQGGVRLTVLNLDGTEAFTVDHPADPARMGLLARDGVWFWTNDRRGVLAVADGTPVWSWDEAEHSVGTGQPIFWGDDLVVMGDDTRLVDPNTGEVRKRLPYRGTGAMVVDLEGDGTEELVIGDRDLTVLEDSRMARWSIRGSESGFGTPRMWADTIALFRRDGWVDRFDAQGNRAGTHYLGPPGEHGPAGTTGVVRFGDCTVVTRELGTDRVVRCITAGETRWERPFLGAAIHVEPVLGEIDANPGPELVVATGAGEVAVLDDRGKTVVQWRAPDAVHTAPLVRDLDGDGLNELVVLSANGEVTALALDPRPLKKRDRLVERFDAPAPPPRTRSPREPDPRATTSTAAEAAPTATTRRPEPEDPTPRTRLEGTVRVGDEPVADAEVFVAGRKGLRTTTDAEGRYVLKLPPGPVRLGVSHPSLVASRAEVVEIAGKRHEHDLALFIPAWARGSLDTSVLEGTTAWPDRVVVKGCGDTWVPITKDGTFLVRDLRRGERCRVSASTSDPRLDWIGEFVAGESREVELAFQEPREWRTTRYLDARGQPLRNAEVAGLHTDADGWQLDARTQPGCVGPSPMRRAGAEPNTRVCDVRGFPVRLVAQDVPTDVVLIGPRVVVRRGLKPGVAQSLWLEPGDWRVYGMAETGDARRIHTLSGPDVIGVPSGTDTYPEIRALLHPDDTPSLVPFIATTEGLVIGEGVDEQKVDFAPGDLLLTACGFDVTGSSESDLVALVDAKGGCAGTVWRGLQRVPVRVPVLSEDP